jgi:hypothetical protein
VTEHAVSSAGVRRKCFKFVEIAVCVISARKAGAMGSIEKNPKLVMAR